MDAPRIAFAKLHSSKSYASLRCIIDFHIPNYFRYYMFSHPWPPQCWRRCSFSTYRIFIFSGRSLHEPGASSASTLPAPFRALITSTVDRINSSDRGAARERNAATAANRASHFGRWCSRFGFSDLAFEFTSAEEAGTILAAYAQEIAEDKGLAKKTHPHVKTIQNYLRAAATPAIIKGYHDPRFLRFATDRSGNRVYIPLLDKVFATAKK